MTDQWTTVDLLGMPIACVDENAVLDQVFGTLREGHGGWLITANLDFLRRFVDEPQTRELFAASKLMVADGMPLVWAARLAGRPLPERVAGSSLIYRFAERAALERRSLYFLGGEPGAGPQAARVLCERWPSLQVAGCSAPQVGMPPSASELDAIRGELARCRPDLLLVALGSPKQEILIRELQREFPQMWMVGVGISFSYVAGQVARAPSWMRASGLEWAYRLAQEPRRLAKRYLVHDLPFAARLFAWAVRARARPVPPRDSLPRRARDRL